MPTKCKPDATRSRLPRGISEARHGKSAAQAKGSANAEGLSDAERAAIQKAREFCIELLGGRERLNLRSFFGGSATSDALHAQVNECAMRELPRYLPPANR
jgi:hypothetical protein